MGILDLKEYGWRDEMLPENAEGVPARVTAVHRERYELVCTEGMVSGRLKTAVYYGGEEEFPTVGDFVMALLQPDSDAVIVKTLPRRSFFSRRDPTPGRGEQAVAANFDFVFVMTSLNKDFNVGRLERYMTLAWQSGALPVVVLTKSDLCDDFSGQLGAVESTAVGAEVVAISAVTGQGLDKLAGYLTQGKTAVFLGSSGVGKSSLVNALAGEMLMDVKEIREDDSRGRHTTTHRQLLKLPSGALVIDTPGMRELGMWSVGAGLGGAFADVESVLERGCKFSDCEHKTEPGCTVRAALESGELSAERWESYLKLKHEARYTDDREGFMRERQQRHKEISTWLRKNAKNNKGKK